MRRPFTTPSASHGQQSSNPPSTLLAPEPAPTPPSTLRILREPDEVAAAMARAAEWELRHVSPVEQRTARYRNEATPA